MSRETEPASKWMQQKPILRRPGAPATVAELALTRAELDGLAAGATLAIVVAGCAIVLRLDAAGEEGK